MKISASLKAQDSNTYCREISRVNVSYKSGKLRDTCLEQHEAEKELGRLIASDLIDIISEIEAVAHAGEMSKQLNHRNIHTNKCIRICIGDEKTAIFVAVGEKYEKHDNNHPIWSTVTRVRLNKII